MYFGSETSGLNSKDGLNIEWSLWLDFTVHSWLYVYMHQIVLD